MMLQPSILAWHRTAENPTFYYCKLNEQSRLEILNNGNIKQSKKPVIKRPSNRLGQIYMLFGIYSQVFGVKKQNFEPGKKFATKSKKGNYQLQNPTD